jgi:hypothetical protein
LSATGNSLRWTVTDLGDLSHTGVGTRAQLRRIGDVLAMVGATVTIEERDRPVLDIGYGQNSLLGWMLLGSRRLKPRRLRSLFALR